MSSFASLILYTSEPNQSRQRKKYIRIILFCYMYIEEEREGGKKREKKTTVIIDQ
jgi:hypothetical protein